MLHVIHYISLIKEINVPINVKHLVLAFALNVLSVYSHQWQCRSSFLSSKGTTLKEKTTLFMNPVNNL